MTERSVALVRLLVAHDERQVSTSPFSAHDLVDIATGLDQLAFGRFEASEGVQLRLC